MAPTVNVTDLANALVQQITTQYSPETGEQGLRELIIDTFLANGLDDEDVHVERLVGKVIANASKQGHNEAVVTIPSKFLDAQDPENLDKASGHVAAIVRFLKSRGAMYKLREKGVDAYLNPDVNIVITLTSEQAQTSLGEGLVPVEERAGSESGKGESESDVDRLSKKRKTKAAA